jgi:hypothetical protein
MGIKIALKIRMPVEIECIATAVEPESTNDTLRVLIIQSDNILIGVMRRKLKPGGEN